MFLRFCFAILAFVSIYFTFSFFQRKRISDKISMCIIIFEIIAFVAIEYLIWGD